MFVTNKKMKKIKTEMYLVAGTGVVTGVTGTVLGAVALVSGSKTKKKTEERFVNVEKHLSAVESATTKCCKALNPMQQSLIQISNQLFENGLILKP